MKKLVSFVLIIAILIGCVPISVFATDTAIAKRYSVLVLDVSGNAEFISGGETIYTADSAINYVKSSAITFLDNLVNTEGENYVAIVTYADTGRVISNFTDDMSDVKKKINSLEKISDVRDMESGLQKAENLLDRITDDNAEKNLVLVGTGMVNNGDYSYDGIYDDTTVGHEWYRTNTDIHLYAYANKAIERANSIKEKATIYTLGLFQTMKNITGSGKEIAALFRLTLQDLATSFKHAHEIDDPADMDFVFEEIAEDITAGHGYFKYAGHINSYYDSISDYYYSDSYFYKDSSIYNDSLATMSLCFELTSWCSHNQDSWYNPKYTEADAEFWQDKLVNAKTLLLGSPNGNADYPGLGFSNFAANEYWEKTPTLDSIGACAARKQITDSNGENYTLVALAVRGGGYEREWGSNFTIGKSGEHTGFAQARDEVIAFLEDYVAGLGATESKKLKLWIVGYSRAAATANMTAAKLNSFSSLANATVAQKDIYCYTFEAPQGAMKEQAQGDFTNIHNIINTNDLVPMVAPSAWDFVKYNYQNDIILPSRYTTSSETFESQLNDMLEELDNLGYKSFDYKINEISTVQDIHIDKSKILPGGDPFIWYTDSSVDTYSVLQDGVDFLADDILQNRLFYYNNLEEGMRELMDMMMGSGMDIQPYLSELLSVKSLVYIVSPMLNINPFYSYEKRLKEVNSRLKEKIVEAFDGFAQSEGFVESVAMVLSDTITQLADDVWNNNMDSVNVIYKLADTILTSGFQAHSPEICLAWLRSLDINYNKDLVVDSVSSITRHLRVSVKGNINIYDTEHNLMASVVNGVKNEKIDGVVCVVNENGESLFYLPGDTAYTVEISATEDGVLNYSVGEHNFVMDSLTRSVNYYDISVATGDIIKGVIPAIPEEELAENNKVGSSVSYTLHKNGSKIAIDEKLKTEENYDVTLDISGNGGYVNGAGTFAKGSVAEITATTLPGGQFYGWYINDTLVSQDLTYSLTVLENTHLVAKFSNISFNTLTIQNNPGGTVDAVSGKYSSGMEITLKATADAGYVFAGWKATAGKLSKTNSAETVFTMPDTAVTVTADFVKTDENGGAWLKDGGKWRYRMSDGSYADDGWKHIDGEWYYFNSDGYMAEGWIFNDGDWYYLNPANGIMQRGWIEVDGEKYYMETSGAMRKGWLKYEDKWYYFNPANGIMQRGWICDSDQWYYMNDDGVMVTGWIQDGDTTYYCKPDTGAMVRGWNSIEGQWHEFSTSGAYCQTAKTIGTDFVAKITTNADQTKALSLDANNVELREYDGKKDQLWKFELQDDGSYKIVNRSTNGCLDVQDFGTTNGTNIQTWKDNGLETQRWVLTLDGNNKGYTLRPVNALDYYTVMDVINGVTDNGSNIVLSKSHFGTNQQFTITAIDESKDITNDIMGDIDCSGKLSVNDVTYIQKVLVGSFTAPANKAALGDVNGNGKIDIRDATIIQLFLAKLIDILPKK